MCDRLEFAAVSFGSRTTIWGIGEEAPRNGSTPWAVRSLRSGFQAIIDKSRHTSHVSQEKSRFSLQFRLRGGERGIRTLDTGVSPHNGLAIVHPRALTHIFKHLQSHPELNSDIK